MAESAAKKNSLTSTQEGLIAGVVILFFGLLYWYLNPWKTEDKATPATTQQATGGVVRSSLASDTSTSPSEGSNIAGNFTDNVQTTTTSATSNTESTSTNTTTTTAATASVAPPPYPSETTAKPLASTEAAKVASTTTAATTAEPTQEPAATPTASSTQTASEIAAAPTSTETAKPADRTTSTDTTKVETATETAAAPTVTANTSTEAAKTAPATETAASTTTATPTASTNINTTTSSTQTTTPAASKLVLAPNSPEAKLQGYLETGTLETPVTIPNLQFEPKATKLTKDSEAEALMLAALLGQYPQANFLITAYTTESTKEQNSEQLSLQRANALGEELVKAGIDGKRITIMGMGNKPAADKSSAAQKKNQRIEISVIQ